MERDVKTLSMEEANLSGACLNAGKRRRIWSMGSPTRKRRFVYSWKRGNERRFGKGRGGLKGETRGVGKQMGKSKRENHFFTSKKFSRDAHFSEFSENEVGNENFLSIFREAKLRRSYGFSKIVHFLFIFLVFFIEIGVSLDSSFISGQSSTYFRRK